ncbi:ATP-dependent bile acid transporter [Cryptococcus wingfieldii CBS 7118]|uniref:ATP-dependent bile acid transporter n=1 Tax=Cryptococcus wingfieldii CBS 7118 TaxID=1295528 RepID=A0A1E3K744_9TREE|nr:ATP-dependent bile acid transporter [Cryptococcus wingfieldii CBS 7118]ODO08357.1 ATP-dependent bile acid transporter [Cryptococcus wingfieldii CBS 7118]
MSSSQSETATLLPSDEVFSRHLDWTDQDRPVRNEEFLKNVKYHKVALGLSLPVTLGLEIWHLILSLKELTGLKTVNQAAKAAIIGQAGIDGIGTAAIACLTLLYVVTLFRNITIPRTLSLTPKMEHATLHRALCQLGSLSTLLLIGLHAMPSIAYTIITHLSPPSLSAAHATSIRHLRTVALVATLFAVGLMRRGPKLYSPPPRLGTGFGLNNEKEDNVRGEESPRVVIKLTPAAEEADPLLSAVTIDQQEQALPSEPSSNVFDYDNSAMLVFAVIGYMAPLAIRSAYVDSLQQSDLPLLDDRTRNSGIDSSIFSADNIRKSSIPASKVGSWQLVKTLWAGRGLTVMVSFILETTRNIISFVQIAAMHEIILSFNEPSGSDKSYAYLMCWGLFFGQTVNGESGVDEPWTRLTITAVLLSAYCSVRENYMLHTPVRMSISTMFLAKILRTTDAKALEAHNVVADNQKKDNRGRGQAMNLLTIDAKTVASLATHSWALTNGMTTLIIGTAMLYKMLGVSAFVGIACVPLSAPFSWPVARWIYTCDKEWMRSRDARTGALKEFLLGIKVIKLNAWEPYFAARIAKFRADEVKWQRWMFTLTTVMKVLADQLPLCISLITFWFYTKIMGNPLNAATAFVSLSVFGRVKDGLQSFPQVIQNILTCRVCLERLSRYLSQPEIDTDKWEHTSRRISADSATITWPAAEDIKVKESGRFKLRDVDLNVPEGKLTVLCGPLGAGKTLLLRAFLGEAKVENGTVFAPRSLPDATPVLSEDETSCIQWTTEMWLNDSVAYAPQQSFIRHGTIRDNILFGQPMWEERYREALRQAALSADLEMFDDGDLTEVGENGVTLSGGQKARVNLARCLYSRASTVYLDDILSAVDAHTAQNIFAECLQGGLLETRTTVLVTHHVRLVLPAASFIIALTKDGKVEQACPTSDAKLGALALENEPPLSELGVAREGPRDLPGGRPLVSQIEKKDRARDVSSAIPRASRQVYAEEHREIGRVSRNHYLLIFQAAGGKLYWALLLLIFGGQRALTLSKNFWLAHWSSDPDPEHLDYNLGVFAIIIVLVLSVGALRWVWLYGVRNVGFYSRGSRLIHDVVMTRLFTAPLQFFETTPQGRILNVLGQDIRRLDCNAADDFGRLGIATAAGVVFYKAPAVTFVALLFGLPLFWISGHINKMRSDIRRLTATASSPLFSLYNEAIDGVVMTRAFGQSQLLKVTMQILNNRERAAQLAAWVAYQWVTAVVKSLSSIVITATGFLLVGQNISPSQAGLILGFALRVSSGLFSLMERYSLLEQTFVSAERVNYYINMPDHESEEGILPPNGWPASGKVEVQDLSVRYAPDLPKVLNKVSFTIEPGHRVGLVGATGSGKSALALALMRAIGDQEGRMLIDGIDTNTVMLPELRRRLNIISQDGTLCSGSLRESLDVTGLRTDSDIYEALCKVHLISRDMSEEDRRENPFADLNTYVAIEGGNFSQGQRQLLCLARALLKDSKILIMDEATSSVDFATDAKITATIKEYFAGTTMLVIAHRLATIMDFDRILVLDRGEVIEEGKPGHLIRNHTTEFHALCMAQGNEEYCSLLAMVDGTEFK